MDISRFIKSISAALALFSCLQIQPAQAIDIADTQDSGEAKASVDQRIAFYQKKLEQHPKLFIVHTQLAAAYLDKAREAIDPKWLKLADESLHQSLKIYANFDAYKGLEIMNAYRHQFAEARRWGEIAQQLFPEDYEVIAVLAEADLGLGDINSAIKRLPPLGSDPQVFHIAVAMANVYKAQGKFTEARNMFLKAEQMARTENFTYLAMWSRTNAAGMLIDSGHAKDARADLEAATAIRKGDPILRLHWAEYHEALNEPEKALNILESMLEDAPHPSYYYRAYRLAKKLGDTNKAKAYYAAAEKGYIAPLQAGEIYTLGSLAELYCEADTHLDKALEMAQRNLKYKRDPEAQQAIKCVQTKLAAQKGKKKVGAANKG